MLKRITNRLYELPKPKIDSTFHTGKRAAVLLPLCDIKGVPSVIFTLRSDKVRTHKGQVSFPGGHLDLNDECMEGCAQRECMEELGLRVVAPSDRRLWEAEWRKRPYYPESNVLGRLPNCVAVTGTLVTPIVGYLGPIDMAHVESLVNRDEVAEVFAMSVRELMTPTNVVHEDLKMVRPRRPRALCRSFSCPLEAPSACRAPCEAALTTRRAGAGGRQGTRMPAFVSGKHRVWGLTAYILHHFLMNIMLPSLLVGGVARPPTPTNRAPDHTHTH